jgi:transposase
MEVNDGEGTERDLRSRVVMASSEGMSAWQAAARFGVGVSRKLLQGSRA